MEATVVVLAVLTVAAFAAYPLLSRLQNRGFLVLSAACAVAFAAVSTLLPATFAGENVRFAVEWIPQFGINLSFHIDLFANCLAMLVTGAGALVLLYCYRYFSETDANIPRFGAVFTAFATSMLGLVLADNVYLLFIFWEATTVLSFLLIGHSGVRRSNRVAALEAIFITTLGGLAMLVGLVLLHVTVGSANLSDILAAAPSGTLVTVAIYLLLAGAISKSAVFPFHFWLPQAMAAPTPVSAYLHAAAMVKAGIYLLARLTPVFADVPGYQWTLVALGGFTMLLGAVRALRQHDLKLLLAFGTVSQLGMLTMLYGVGVPEVTSAATVLLFAHALGKAPLFLSVGIIEHRTGTRDLRKINGLGKASPGIAAVATLAALSMIGAPPLFGYVAKEAVLHELFHQPLEGATLAALAVMILGSILTVAYTIRFIWGAFATKNKSAEPQMLEDQPLIMFAAPWIFTLVALAAGIFASTLDPIYQKLIPSHAHPEHLALWHGITPPLITTAIILAVGVALIPLFGVKKTRIPGLGDHFSASGVYFRLIRWLEHFSVWVTSLTQRGSLPFYLSVIMVVAGGTVGGAALFAHQPFVQIEIGTPLQIVVGAGLVLAAIATMLAKKRFQIVILVGFTGYAMAIMFALHGAPDLALTQMLVETVTLIAFVLVSRRLPQRLDKDAPTAHDKKARALHIVISVGLALTLGAMVLVALGARDFEPISQVFPKLAVEGGHGKNVVNVTLVDIRGWDTFLELSVIIAAATGVASLLFLSERGDNLPKISRKEARQQVHKYMQRVLDPSDPVERGQWMLAGRDLDPEKRSIVLEVVVRLLFPSLIVLSIYLLFVGHNQPGGGFAGGLVAGLALVARYLAGGRTELGATMPFDAGKIVGAGMATAAITALVPIFFGQSALTSSWIDLNLGVFGEISIVSSAAFDIGVYLVVIGLVLDVLRSLGSQIDVHKEEDRELASQEVKR
ncbi:MAG: Na+/H+ antiporter subunit A [Microbacteriaceae bacterium]|nr:Na+/H+ antiporter subunit A [Microbacteriaceae bacterium]